MGAIEASVSLPLKLIASAIVGGPKKASTEVFSSGEEVAAWLGKDSGPATKAGLSALEKGGQLFICVATGSTQLGTSLRVDAATLNTTGIMGGTCVIRYTVHKLSGVHPAIVGEPYCIVSVPTFSGYGIQFLSHEEHAEAGHFKVAGGGGGSQPDPFRSGGEKRGKRKVP